MEASFMYLPAEFLYQSQSTSLCQSLVSTRSALRSPLIQRCIFDPSEGKIGKVESRRLCVPDALDLLHIFKGGMKKFPARGLRLRAQFFFVFWGKFCAASTLPESSDAAKWTALSNKLLHDAERHDGPCWDQGHGQHTLSMIETLTDLGLTGEARKVL